MKLYEGLASTLIKCIKKGMMSSLKSKLGALLCKSAIKDTLKEFDADKYGGAPLLGLNGLVVKVHGSSHNVEVKNAVAQCIQFKKQDIQGKIQEKISNVD